MIVSDQVDDKNPEEKYIDEMFEHIDEIEGRTKDVCKYKENMDFEELTDIQEVKLLSSTDEIQSQEKDPFADFVNCIDQSYEISHADSLPRYSPQELIRLIVEDLGIFVQVEIFNNENDQNQTIGSTQINPDDENKERLDESINRKDLVEVKDVVRELDKLLEEITEALEDNCNVARDMSMEHLKELGKHVKAWSDGTSTKDCKTVAEVHDESQTSIGEGKRDENCVVEVEELVNSGTSNIEGEGVVDSSEKGLEKLENIPEECEINFGELSEERVQVFDVLKRKLEESRRKVPVINVVVPWLATEDLFL